jgi:hypothetical protein
MHSEIDSEYTDYFKDEDAITEEEKRQILDQIRQIAADNQDAAPADARPPRKGHFFPLMVNLVVLAVTAVAICGSILLFHMRRERLEAEASRYNSMEGEILEEYKRETGKRLQEKDAAILNILNQLGALERERRQLADLMEIRLRQKERELRVSLDAELAERRRALLDEGIRTDQVDQKLREYETGKQRQIEAELRTYREETQRVTEEKTARLLREREIARQALEQTTLEREEYLPDDRPAPQAVPSPEPAPRAGEPPAASADQGLIARLQEELKAKEAQIEELQSRPAPAPAAALPIAAAPAPAPAASPPPEQPPAEAAALGREEAAPAAPPPIAAAPAAAPPIAPAPAVEAPSYRALGTVTLTEPEQVIILPMIDLPAAPGSPIEIRRILASGKIVRVAGGRVLRVEGEKIVARIEDSEGGYRPVVTDKVYLQIEPGPIPPRL